MNGSESETHDSEKDLPNVLGNVSPKENACLELAYISAQSRGDRNWISRVLVTALKFHSA